MRNGISRDDRDLTREELIKIYVKNITSNELILNNELKNNKEYIKNPLHRLICDVRYEGYKKVNKNTTLTISENQLENINKYGYCELLIASSYE